MFPIMASATTSGPKQLSALTKGLFLTYDNMIIGKLSTRLFSKLQRMTSAALQIHSYIWIDLEMTGLDPEKDQILEISCIVTNSQLHSVHDGISYVIHQPDDVLNSMNSWCIKTHGKSGLTEACRNSKISISEADREVAKYIQLHSHGHKYLAGNSVYMDKIFLMKYMPCVNNLLHYRILDVSTLKLILSDWYPEEFPKLPKKMLNHRAQDDILESIEELKNYKKTFFK